MVWGPVLFCLWEILNARWKTRDVKWELGQGPPLRRRRRFLKPSFLGDKSSVSGTTLSPLASDTTVFCFFLTFAKVKQEMLDLRGSNSYRMTGGWMDGWNAATETWQHVGFAFRNWGLRFLYWFKVFACRWKNQLLTWEFPQPGLRCPQSKIETDCSVSEKSVKSLRGAWIIRHDSSCVLGGLSERRWKLPTNTWNEQRLQVVTHSRAARTRVCCKPHVGIRCNLLEGETGAWVQNWASRLCFSYSMSRADGLWGILSTMRQHRNRSLTGRPWASLSIQQLAQLGDKQGCKVHEGMKGISQEDHKFSADGRKDTTRLQIQMVRHRRIWFLDQVLDFI